MSEHMTEQVQTCANPDCDHGRTLLSPGCALPDIGNRWLPKREQTSLALALSAHESAMERLVEIAAERDRFRDALMAIERLCVAADRNGLWGGVDPRDIRAVVSPLSRTGITEGDHS